MTIAQRLMNLYDNLVLSVNFINNEIKRVLKRWFYDTAEVSSGTYTILAGKLYELDFSSVSDPVIDLDTEATLLTDECPEWHFFFTAGSDAPAWSAGGSSVTIAWNNTPTFTDGNLYEVSILYVNNGTGVYQGLVVETSAAS